MKKLVVGLLIASLTNLSIAQSQKGNELSRVIKLEPIVITPLVNMDYMSKVQDANTPKRVKHLEDEAIFYDISKSEVFKRNYDDYTVFFKQNKGQIAATYDAKGKILNSFEKYVDVILPIEVRNAVNNAYPNWTMKTNIYRVSYYHNKEVKKIYQIQIVKDNLTLNLKIDSNGVILKQKAKAV